VGNGRWARSSVGGGGAHGLISHVASFSVQRSISGGPEAGGKQQSLRRVAAAPLSSRGSAGQAPEAHGGAS